MKKLIILFLILAIFYLPNLKADVVSVNSGGDNGIVINSDNYIEGFFSCVPMTCAKLGYNCGGWDDSCGGILNCGSCSSGYTCTAGICTGTITPTPGGGAGGAGTVISTGFILDKDLIKTLISQGGSQEETIQIKNIGSSKLNIVFTPDDSLKKFMIIDEPEFELDSGKTKEISIDFFSAEKELPQIVSGRITVKDDAGDLEIINVVLEIKERNPLFDVLVSVQTEEVTPQSNVKAKIKISNFGDLNNMDIQIYSAIKSFNGSVISFRDESIAINKELEITRSLRVPKGTPYGIYLFYTKASYENITGSSVDTFEVVEKKKIDFSTYLIIGAILVGVLIIIGAIFFIKRKKRDIIQKNIINKKEPEKEKRLRKLKNKHEKEKKREEKKWEKIYRKRKREEKILAFKDAIKNKIYSLQKSLKKKEEKPKKQKVKNPKVHYSVSSHKKRFTFFNNLFKKRLREIKERRYKEKSEIKTGHPKETMTVITPKRNETRKKIERKILRTRIKELKEKVGEESKFKNP